MRWKAPVPAAAWTGVHKSDIFGPSCIQTIAKERKHWTYGFMTHGEIRSVLFKSEPEEMLGHKYPIAMDFAGLFGLLR